MAATRSDEKLRQDVLDAIRHDSRINSGRVAVSAINGAVNLYGSVPTYAQKLDAGKDAARVKGVTQLTNELIVRTVTPWTDAEIADVIRGNLQRDARIERAGWIDVSVFHGAVTLSGTVSSYAQKSDATDDAWTAPGVIAVDNNLTVAPVAKRADAAIAADVRAAIAADTSVNSAYVGVDVINGTVFLRGTVPSFYQIGKVGDDARDVAGVVNVENELTVGL